MAVVTDWLGFRAAVLAAVSAAMPADVLAATGVDWADGPRSFAGQHLLLSIVSAVFEDQDSSETAGGMQVLESMAVITVQISAEAVGDAGDGDALWLIEQVRLGLRRVSVRESLEAAGIVIQVFPRSTRNVGGTADDRALSVHAIEVVFCATFGLTTTEDAGEVASVGITATIVAGASDELELSFQVPEA